MRRISMHRLQELVRLYRLGEGARSIARQLRMSPNTERQYRNALETAGLLAGDAESLPDLAALRLAIEAHKPTRPPPQHESSVERWREDVEAFVTAGATPCRGPRSSRGNGARDVTIATGLRGQHEESLLA